MKSIYCQYCGCNLNEDDNLEGCCNQCSYKILNEVKQNENNMERK